MKGAKYPLVLLLALAPASGFAFADGPQQAGPSHVPYDNVSGYDYPNYLISSPEGPTWTEEELKEWQMWWQEFDGGQPSDPQQDQNQSDQQQNQSDQQNQSQQEKPEEKPPVAYVVWIASPAEPNIYWKDKTYDVYSGWNWSNSGNGSYSSIHGQESVGFQILRVLHGGNYTIQMIRPGTSGSFIDSDSFTLLNGSANYTLSRDSYADYSLEINATEGTSFTYNATFFPAGNINESKAGPLSEIPESIRRTNLQLPENIDPALRELARNLTDESLSPLKQAEKNRDWVHNWVEYDLFWASNQTIPKSAEMANWTFVHRKGICAHYASLYTVISRLQGIPTRVATGFAGGYPSGNSSYIFPIFGHAWAESYIPPFGWVPIDPTGNVTEREKEDGSGEKQNVSLEWSDAGKVTLDLHFTLNKTFSEEAKEEFKRQIEEEMKRNGTLDESANMTQEEIQQIQEEIERLGEERLEQFQELLEELSHENFTSPGNLSQMNWSDYPREFKPLNQSRFPYNRTDYNNSRYNYTRNASNNSNQYLHNASKWNWTSNYTKQGNWTQFNKSWNDSRLRETYLNPSYTPPPWNESSRSARLREEIRRAQNQSNSTESRIAKSLASASGQIALFFIALLAGAALLGAALLLRERMQPGEGKAAADEKRLRELFRKVDMEKVVNEYLRLGREGKPDEAVIYAYNELADFIACAFRIANDPSKTAREFKSALASTRVDMDSLKAITFTFEKTRYAGRTGKHDYEEFLQALKSLAESRRKAG